jgi:hypothetical protein
VSMHILVHRTAKMVVKIQSIMKNVRMD